MKKTFVSFLGKLEPFKKKLLFLKTLKLKVLVPLMVVVIGLVILPVVIFQVGKSQDNRQRAVSENAPSIRPKIAVIMVYFDYPSPTPPLTPFPTKIPPLTPYPTFPTDTPPLTTYPTFDPPLTIFPTLDPTSSLDPTLTTYPTPFPTLPVDPVTNSVLTVDLVKDILEGNGYGGQESVNSFYNKVTAGKIQFNFDYFGWYAANQIVPEGCAGGFDVMEIGNKILRDKGVDLSSYDMRLYISSPINSCAPGYGQPKNNFIDAMAYINNTPVVSVYSHEVGHSLGLHHANTLSCPDPNSYFRCESVEYGDPFDIMGAWAATSYFNAPHQIGLGLLLTDQIQTVTQNGIYEIVPIGLKTNKIQTLKIIKRDSKDWLMDSNTSTNSWHQHYYYVEYRRPEGVDLSHLPDQKEGLLVHSWNGVNFSQTNLVNPYSKLLLVGETFNDKINNLKITMISHNDDSAQVKIEGGPNTFTTLPNPDRYSLELNPSSEITISTGQEIILDAQILLDGKPLENKSAHNYKWALDESLTKTLSVTPKSFCEAGMVEPCPQSQAKITGLQQGMVDLIVYINNPEEGASVKGKFYINVSNDTVTPTISPTNTVIPTTNITPLLSPTTSNTDASQPTPSPTDIPGEQYAIFKIELPGIGYAAKSLGLNSNPVNPQRSVTVQILNDKNEKITTATGYLNYVGDGIGRYVGKIGLGTKGVLIKPGYYSAKIKTENGLYKKIPGIIQITTDYNTPEPPIVSIVSGDLNGDNNLSIADYTMYIACYKGFSSCTQQLKTKADFNDDGNTAWDNIDLNILQRGFSIREGD